MRYSNDQISNAWIKPRGWTVTFYLFIFLTEEDPAVTHHQRTRLINLTKWRENNFGVWDDENNLFIYFLKIFYRHQLRMTNNEPSCCWKELEGNSAGDYQSTAVVKLTLLNASECAWDFILSHKQKLFIFFVIFLLPEIAQLYDFNAK